MEEELKEVPTAPETTEQPDTDAKPIGMATIVEDETVIDQFPEHDENSSN